MTSDPIAKRWSNTEIHKSVFFNFAKILTTPSNSFNQFYTLSVRGSRYMGAEDCAWPLRAPL
jgi:hypothetical protein